MYYIYEIKNNINGKTYIGQHKSVNVSFSYMGSGIALNKAFHKYGMNNFSKSILAISETKENINVLEKVFIALYRAEGKAEYNIADGGSISFSGEIEKNRKFLISKTSKERWKNPEYKNRVSEKISLSNIGRPRKPHTDEAKKKISFSSKERWKNPEYKKRVSEKLKKPRPDLKGKDAWNKGKSTGMHWWTNGVENKLSLECPPGFYSGKHLSEETKKKISESKRINPNRNRLGKHLSEETKKKMRNYMIGRKMKIVDGKRTWVKE